MKTGTRIAAVMTLVGFFATQPYSLSAQTHRCHGEMTEKGAMSGEMAQSHMGMDTHMGMEMAGGMEMSPAAADHENHADHQMAAVPADGMVHWEVTGRYLDACRCDVSCPCGLGMSPDYDTCDPTFVFQIEHGIYDGVGLDDLAVAIVTDGTFTRFYLDHQSTESQRKGLEGVARMLAETLVREGFTLAADQQAVVATIDIEMSDEAASVVIPGVLEIRAHALVGGDGEGPIEVSNLDLGPTWMTKVWLAQADVYTYGDAANWDHSGRSAMFGRFDAMGMLR